MASEARPLRLVHTSDVHLGAYSASPRGREEPRGRRLEAGFEAVIDLAIGAHADVLLIAGDFFDHARIGPEVAEFAAAQINRFPGETVILPGNHDPIGRHGPYERHDLEALAPRLRLVREPEGEFLDFPALDLAVWGRAITVDVLERPSPRPRPAAATAPGTSPSRTAIPSPRTRSWSAPCGSRRRTWPRARSGSTSPSATGTCTAT